MADLKEKFRQLKAQKQAAAPTKEQIKALKAQRQAPNAAEAGRSAAATTATPAQAQLKLASSAAPTPPAALPQVAPKEDSRTQLPSDFFHSAQQLPYLHKLHPSQTAGPGSLTTAPAVPAVQALQGAGSKQAAPIPQGFFADKAADAKARGVHLPDKKHKEANFQSFLKDVDVIKEDIAKHEEEEEEEAADEREQYQQIEQQMLLDRLEKLRQKQLQSSSTNLDIPIPTTKRRKVLQELGAVLQQSSSSGEDSEAELMDWRAKKL